MLLASRAIASVILLLLLAACGSKPVAKDPPPPAGPSYLSVLDGGKITPLDQPVVVTMKPFPTATYQKTKQLSANVAYQEVERIAEACRPDLGATKRRPHHRCKLCRSSSRDR